MHRVILLLTIVLTSRAGTSRADPDRLARRVDALFLRLDADRDGALTRAEVADGPLAPRFDDIDRDRDGRVVWRELRVFLEHAMASGRA